MKSLFTSLKIPFFLNFTRKVFKKKTCRPQIKAGQSFNCRRYVVTDAQVHYSFQGIFSSSIRPSYAQW